MRIPRLVAVAAGITAIVAATASGSSGAVQRSGSVPGGASLADVAVRPGLQHVGRVQPSPPTTASCRRDYKVACYQPAQIQQAYHLPALYARGVTGPGYHDRHRRLVRLTDDNERPGHLRPGLRPARAAVVPDHLAGRPGARLRPEQLRHGRLGRRDDPGRGVRARGRAGGEPAAGPDPGAGNRGRARLPADRRGREVRAQAPPRRRDQPELQRHRADLPQPGRGQAAARRLPARRQGPASRCWPRRGTRAPPTSSSTRAPTTCPRRPPGRTATRW